MNFSAGLKFKKVDLHIHTPASVKDYEDKSIIAQDIVKNALEKGLHVIAITDHQTATWINLVKEAAKGTNLIVLPGVEILASGGEKGVHVIALFDIDKDENHITKFLSTIKIYDQDTPTELNVGLVADELNKYDESAILILAHCHSSKGVTGDIKGKTREIIFAQDRKCILGAEANESDFLDENKIRDHKRVIDCFDGKNTDYGNKKLGVYQSSDSHSLDSIGSSFTFFKIDDNVTIEDVRQCLIDRETRIRQSFEYREYIYPHIESMKITSGFLDGQQIHFHEGLNSLLGSKGVGKSLVIEFLRFALNQSSNDRDIKKDHDTKIEKCLKQYGTIEVIFVDLSGHKYKVLRTYDPGKDNPIEMTDLSDGSSKDINVEQLFPVLFLSQNEIIRIAEDQSGDNQRSFIDRFFPFYKYQNQIKRLNTTLKDVDIKFADALKARLRSLSLQKDISTLKEEIASLERTIKNKVFSRYSKAESIGQAISKHVSYLDSLEALLNNTQLEYKDLLAPTTGEKDVDSDPSVKRASECVSQVISKITDNISDAKIILTNKRRDITKEFADWKASFEPIKAEYEKVVKDTGGTQPLLDQKRKKLISDKAILEKDEVLFKGKAQQIRAVATVRDETIKKLEDEYKSYYKERTDKCEFFTSKSKGSLKVTINEGEDRTTFKDNLLNLRRGSHLREEQIEKITSKMSPKDFIDSIFRYEWDNRKEKKYLDAIVDKAEVPLEYVEKLANHLLDNCSYEEILAVLYNSVPKDVPIISYSVQGKYKSLDELSVGQKAVALLIIALSEGAFPIIIDQPEDSLDIRSIWEDVCGKLRSTKEMRQFIFTTHNSSVAVASDTDKFTILEADANHGKIISSASINRKPVKDEIINVLEGGPTTYNNKRHKYNL